MSVFVAFALILFASISTAEECGMQSNFEACEQISSLKGLLNVMQTVTSAMGDLVSSANYRAEKAGGFVCTNYKTENSSLPNDGNEDHCLKAEPDCFALKQLGFTDNGVYRIWPKFLNHSIHVYCDMNTDGGGWTIIQRRGDFGEPRVNFFETWDNYKHGFGNIEQEFWLGNDFIFALTNQAKTTLRIDLEDFENEKRFAKYQNFLVRSELEKYRLTFGDYDGTAGDSLNTHNDQEFATKDTGSSCAINFKGGWWYAKCHEANLNGIYHKGNYTSYADGVNWLKFRGHQYSLKVSEMKIRPCFC